MLLDSSQTIQLARHDYLFLQEIPGAWAGWASSGLPLSQNFSFIITYFSLEFYSLYYDYLINVYLPSPGFQIRGTQDRDNAAFRHHCIPRALLRSGTGKLSKYYLLKECCLIC